MKRIFRSLTAFIVGFSLVLLFGALAYGGTFKTTYRGVEYTIQTPSNFPETLEKSDVVRIQYPGPRLNAIIFKHKGLTGFALLVGSDAFNVDLYPVGAIYTSNIKAKPVMWKYYVYKDYKAPTIATKARAEAWAQGHKFGKPETLKELLPHLQKENSEVKKIEI